MIVVGRNKREARDRSGGNEEVASLAIVVETKMREILMIEVGRNMRVISLMEVGRHERDTRDRSAWETMREIPHS